MKELNILTLHRMGDPIGYRESVRSLEFMFAEISTPVNCIVHDADLPYPEYLRDVQYHLIVLGPTFLCSRYSQGALNEVMNKYDFIRESHACKVAMPQDDYDCCELLDSWLACWKIDLIYTVCPSNWDILYPQNSKAGKIRLGYTGYIDDWWLSAWESPATHNDRPIDISYRASKLPANFGSLGYLKSEIADRFIASLPKNDLCLDISTHPKDVILGKDWHAFLERSKFCLTTASGSSLLDPVGEYRNKVYRFTYENPNASFDEIEAACFLGEDKRYVFTALSPRNIEAALAGTVQIATTGTYSGLMHPGEHYVYLDDACANISDVLSQVKDLSLVQRIQKACKDRILEEPRLRRSVIVQEIIDYAKKAIEVRRTSNELDKKFIAALTKYQNEIEAISQKYWQRRRLFNKARSFAVQLGVQKAKNYIQSVLKN